MKINQELVNKIIERARKSDYGLSKGLDHKNGHLQIDQYEPQDLSALALCLVNGFDAKYDLISVFQAALLEIENQLTPVKESLADYCSKLNNANMIGEFLREKFFKQDRENGKFGCYSTFEVREEVKHLGIKELEGQNHQHYKLDDVEMMYYWDGDGVLMFFFNKEGVENTDCKKDRGWYRFSN